MGRVRAPSKPPRGSGSKRISKPVWRVMMTEMTFYKSRTFIASERRIKMSSKAKRSSSSHEMGTGSRDDPMVIDEEEDDVDLDQRRSREFNVGTVVGIKLKNGKTGRAVITKISESPRSSTITNSNRILHVHWLVRSPLGAENEWFLEDRACEDVSEKYITSTLECHYRPARAAHTGSTSRDDKATVHGEYFKFVLAMSPLVIRDPHHDPTVGCDSCESKRRQRKGTHVYPSSLSMSRNLTETRDRIRGFKFRDQEFHRWDFVFIDSKQAGVPWTIAQIVRLPDMKTRMRATDVKIAVIPFSRTSDERRITRQPTSRLVKIRLDQVLGKCTVTSGKDKIPTTAPGNVAFYCTEELDRCPVCNAASSKSISGHASKASIPRLPCVDLYTGGGGTLLGSKDLFNIKLAVDTDPVSCATLRRNFPGVDVRCETVLDLHDQEMERSGTARPRVLPKRGSIFLLTACPPCQCHSGANQHKDLTDLRSNELFVALSELDRLRPDVFLFENVTGFLSRRTDGTFQRNDQQGVQNGSFAELALKTLISLGARYQCRLAVLDSRSYGSPQNRRRVFIIAAKSGVNLPEFPQPTHANPLTRKTKYGRVHPLGDDDDRAGNVGFHIGSGTPGTGPLPAVTVKDAISDLPSERLARRGKEDGIDLESHNRVVFEYRIPGMAPSRIPTFSAARSQTQRETRIGFDGSARYISDPRTGYQARLRGDRPTVKDHYTPHRSLRELEFIRDSFGYDDAPGCARRLDPEGGFFTLMTSSAPGGKNTCPIHYCQRRTLTIVERKRAQGVPDSYRLRGSVIEQDRQLGNMVDVSVGRAIYSQIYREVVEPQWMKAKGERTLDEFVRTWRD